uniref:Uncharacterized protein n=1 Tax=Rhizophora mucronata TaxID=61149 RepID=A0A2P2PWY3_RHIMU
MTLTILHGNVKIRSQKQYFRLLARVVFFAVQIFFFPGSLILLSAFLRLLACD